ncbi:MAG: hypothetical protein MHM6MM_005040 [Cercozoa sp. M6MM]
MAGLKPAECCSNELVLSCLSVLKQGMSGEKRRVLVVPAKDGGLRAPLQLVKLRHWRQREAWFGVYDSDTECTIMELTRHKRTPASLFIGNHVVRDGAVYLLAPVDVCFLLLSSLDAQKQVDDVSRLLQLLPRGPFVQRADRIADLREVDGDLLLSLNEGKVAQWLQSKVDTLRQSSLKCIERLSSQADKTAMAVGIVGEYLSAARAEALKKTFGVTRQTTAASRSDAVAGAKRSKPALGAFDAKDLEGAGRTPDNPFFEEQEPEAKKSKKNTPSAAQKRLQKISRSAKSSNKSLLSFFKKK